MSQVCKPGDGIVVESSLAPAVAHVAVDELFVTFDVVLTDIEFVLEPDVLIFSIFGMINGVDCDCELVGLIAAGAMDVDCAFDTGTEALIGGIVNEFDVGGNA